MSVGNGNDHFWLLSLNFSSGVPLDSHTRRLESSPLVPHTLSDRRIPSQDGSLPPISQQPRLNLDKPYPTDLFVRVDGSVGKLGHLVP
jgi:hypothetical protein